MAEATGWSRTGSSMTIGFLAMAATSMLWGALSDHFGARAVVPTGATLFALSLWLAGRASTLILFQLSFGRLAGAPSS